MKEITIKDYRDFCSAQYDCDDCSLLGDELTGVYENCLGYVTEWAEKADHIVQEWKETKEKERINKRQTLYVVYDKYVAETIYGIAASEETAKKIIDSLAQKALANCLTVDAKDSGIYWDKMNDEQKAEFYETQIKSSFLIKKMKLDCYIYDKEVYAI